MLEGSVGKGEGGCVVGKGAGSFEGCGDGCGSAQKSHVLSQMWLEGQAGQKLEAQ